VLKKRPTHLIYAMAGILILVGILLDVKEVSEYLDKILELLRSHK